MKKSMVNTMFGIFPELEDICNKNCSEIGVAIEKVIEKVTIKRNELGMKDFL